MDRKKKAAAKKDVEKKKDAAKRSKPSPKKAAAPRKRRIQKFETLPPDLLTHPANSEIVSREPYCPPSTDLPAGYGDNSIYALVRDPYWTFTYWEIRKDHEERKLQELGGDRSKVRSVLRIYDLSASRSHSVFFDIVLQNMAMSWYINTEPNKTYVIEIGLLHEDGRFVALARSNEITTPRSAMSDVIDEEWMGIDFDKMYALSGGFEVGKSSWELRELMERRLREAISSGSGSAGMSGPVKGHEKKFWFVLDCELVVYGATEPGAAVTMQGRPVQLRPDGTFTLRFALPDGKIVLDASAVSPDKTEEIKIIPTVERRTEKPASTKKHKRSN